MRGHAGPQEEVSQLRARRVRPQRPLKIVQLFCTLELRWVEDTFLPQVQIQDTTLSFSGFQSVSLSFSHTVPLALALPIVPFVFQGAHSVQILQSELQQ